MSRSLPPPLLSFSSSSSHRDVTVAFWDEMRPGTVSFDVSFDVCARQCLFSFRWIAGWKQEGAIEKRDESDKVVVVVVERTGRGKRGRERGGKG